ncbi:hypothetical protein Hanom_Chr02g00109741 [Helianthus anomalus]
MLLLLLFDWFYKCNLCDASVFSDAKSNGLVDDLSSLEGSAEAESDKAKFFCNVYKDVKVDVTVGSRDADSDIKSDDVGSGGNIDLMKGNCWSLEYLDAKGINGQGHEEKRLGTSNGEVSRATLGHDQDVQPQARRVLMDTKVK